MPPLRPSLTVLLIALVALWVVCATLHVRQVISGQLAWVGVYVTAPAGDHGLPTVRDFWPGATRDAPGALMVGDHLRSVGTASLRGVGPFGFVARVHAAAADRHHLRVPITYERNGVVGHTRIALIPVGYPWRILPLTGAMVLTAVLVLLRRPGAPIARAFFLLAIAYALHWTFFFGGPRWQTYAWFAVFFCASLVMLPLILRAALVFPTDVAPANGRLPWWPWLFAVFGPISLSWLVGVPLPPVSGFRAVFAVNIIFIAVLLAVLTRNYRRTGALGRRQLKWVVLGIYCGTVPVLLTDAIAVIAPAFWWLHEVAVIAELCVPLAMLIAIVRANLFDVDRLITGAAVSTVLSVLALAAVLSAVPPVAAAVSSAGGLNPDSVRLLLSLAAAAGIVPAYRLLSPRVERLLFRERHALRTGVEGLLRELSAAEAPEALFTLAGVRLDALLRPHTCLIYAPLGSGFAPVFARGIATEDAPPALAAPPALVEALRAGDGPIDLHRWPLAELDEAGRAAIEQLRAAVLLPVHRNGELAAVVCLGTKRSGDIYTATDLALLGAAADKMSDTLQRFDAAVILRHERAMRDALRRYVPAPVAARLSRGQSIDGGECEVSVLFVDIRGYTTYSERQTAGDVFSMVNRYTEAVSGVIERRGGTVVEFLGDGVMAVFGAPEPLPDHARASVEAACEIVATVRRLGLAAADAPIDVGVGIATGRAFVGNVRTNDRLVYTALGDVVNLASRIERLTRDLHASVAIDAHTHTAAGQAGSGFRRHDRIPIRGRAEPVDVYTLPLAGS
jgi:class 3 adenylate cyclase